jgi:two-component system phosphate regulon sensor histidine kinase PhoR
LTARIFAKLILSVLGILVVALTAIDFLVAGVAERTFVDTLRTDLIEKGHLLATVPQDILLRDFDKFAESGLVRLTWIAKDGRVLADSDNRPESMENHGGRPEVIAAFAGRDGWDVRSSQTMGVSFMYAAVPAPGGAFRLAVPLAEVSGQVNELRRKILAFAALAFLPSVLLAAFFARYFSRKLGSIIEFAGRLSMGDFRARLQMENNDELGVLGAKLNDTGQKLQHMFEQLEQEHAELEKLERVRKDFVINVSHELRTPLASIQGYTETLLDGAIHDSEHNVRFLSIIRQNAERLRRLTDDLLTLSRIELRRHSFRFAHYDVNSLLAEQVDAMQPMAEKRDITLTLEAAPGGTEVFCDSEAVHQIATNLIDNALKYTPAGGAVAIGARKAGSDRVMIYVRDTGIGIPEEDLPRLFERFYRVDKARSRELGGTGLGLAIVKHLVLAHGGEVGVESVVNQGSTFSFTVPTEDIGQPELQPVQPDLPFEPSLPVTR